LAGPAVIHTTAICADPKSNISDSLGTRLAARFEKARQRASGYWPQAATSNCNNRPARCKSESKPTCKKANKTPKDGNGFRLADPDTRIIVGDSRTVLKTLEARSVPLVFGEPPFNWQVKYDGWHDGMPRADPNHPWALRSALRHFKQKRSPENAVADALVDCGCDVDGLIDDRTCLHLYGHHEEKQAVSWLLDHGASVHAKTSDGRTLFTWQRNETTIHP
jgi:hypothetical protein